MHQGASGRRAGRVWLYRWTLAALGLLLALVVPAAAAAHPLGNFTVNHYSRLELSPGQARVFYVLDMAEIPTFQIIQQIDRDGDPQISPDEGATFAATQIDELRRGVQLTLNGALIELALAGPPDLSFPPGQGGLSVMRLTFWLTGSLPTEGQEAITAKYRDTNNTERIGWREIVVRGLAGVRVFDSSVSDRDQSDELRTYPQDMLSSPLNQTSARFAFQPAAGQAALPTLVARQPGTATNDGAFAALIAVPRLDLQAVLLALVTAVGLGALHALEPGHGKTVAAAYLVGSRATARHVVLLGLTVTIMHTSSIFVLGLVTLFASQFIVPERLLPWLALASGLIVIVIGVRMFLSRLRQPSAGVAHSHDQAHTHDHHGHAHEQHGHDHMHSHNHDHLPPALAGSAMNWRSVLAIGVSGGLLPCPAGLVVLLSAIGLGRVGFGLLLIVAFSAGLALVLSGVGFAVVYGGRWFSRFAPGARLLHTPMITRLSRFVPAFGSLLVVGAGCLLLYHALPLLRIWQF